MDEMNDYLFTQLPVTHATTSYDKLEKPDDNGRYALHYACMKKESTAGRNVEENATKEKEEEEER